MYTGLPAFRDSGTRAPLVPGISFALLSLIAIGGCDGGGADPPARPPASASPGAEATDPALGAALQDDGAATAGFEGRASGDGTVRLNWRKDSRAAGYNVYRQGKYHGTVRGESFVDAKLADGEYRYEIVSFRAGSDKRFRKVASGLTVKVRRAATASTGAVSSGTAGFEGRTRDDGSVVLSWRKDPKAEGYNVYRQGKYHTTVRGERFVDATPGAGSHRYEIVSFTSGSEKRYRKIASGLTVKVPATSVASNGSASKPAASSGSSSASNATSKPAKSSGSKPTKGFTARVSGDGTVRLGWREDARAEGYNVYRQGKYRTTVRGESFVDAKLADGTYRYEIVAFSGGGKKQYRKVADGLSVKVRRSAGKAPGLAAARPKGDGGQGTGKADSVAQRTFGSADTKGFEGRVLGDGKVRISWPAERGAAGYNLYRQAKYYKTVYGTSFIDSKIFDGDYYYEVQSFMNGRSERYRTIATGLTVKVRGLGRTDPKAPKKNRKLLDGFELVFADEFDTGALDTSKWNTSFLWGADLTINSEKQYYVDTRENPNFGFDPFTFENGKLVINSIRTPKALRAKANGKPYLSGVITSYDAFKFTYGYAETRARMPRGKGYWTAFWLLNAWYGGADPEIDIVEFIGHDQDVAYHTYHYYDQRGRLRSTKTHPTPGIDFTGDFHTFGVDWRPGLLVYYIDGIEVHRVSGPNVSGQNMYLIANTAIGGWWPGNPDESTSFPGRYEIDYIRVYRQVKPYASPLFNDGAEHAGDWTGHEPPDDTGTELVDGVPQDPAAEVSPGHRPPFELWPEGYPGRQ